MKTDRRLKDDEWSVNIPPRGLILIEPKPEMPVRAMHTLGFAIYVTGYALGLLMGWLAWGWR